TNNNMTGSIFLLKDDKELLEMKETPYDSEDLIQQLLQDYPALLTGDQINPEQPRKWLLITREMGVPDTEGGKGRWALDHLFLDQDGIPTLVEVKRSTDTRTRREVVAQMLDYAANSVQYWTIDDIISSFTYTCEKAEKGPGEILGTFLFDTENPDEYWERVQANLRRGNIRLLFVADTIPAELKRIIEFLNEQMNPAEVLGVEVKQYTGRQDKNKTLVSRVVGQTMKAIDTKKIRSGVPKLWDRESFIQQLREKAAPGDAEVVEKIFNWCDSNGFALKFGKGVDQATVRIGLDIPNKGFKQIVLLEGYGGLAFFFGVLGKNFSVFKEQDALTQLLHQLNTECGFKFNPGKIDSYSYSPISTLSDERRVSAFLSKLEWLHTVIEEDQQKD
ncbi:MAG: hypothetical protein D5R96_06835, partial [Methanocalculus sp. MSAO_Arc2]|uniref:hypothetical protein n=1 Tax=Methanocalculus sp. MSAO_Arc2 TaxID=2293855 RepID=UPI000FEEB1D2